MHDFAIESLKTNVNNKNLSLSESELLIIQYII